MNPLKIKKNTVSILIKTIIALLSGIYLKLLRIEERNFGVILTVKLNVKETMKKETDLWFQEVLNILEACNPSLNIATINHAARLNMNDVWP